MCKTQFKDVKAEVGEGTGQSDLGKGWEEKGVNDGVRESE